MLILILYATTDGQTRKIGRRAADTLIALGHSVEIVNAAEAADLDPSRYRAAIIAGSVHAGRYQSELGKAVTAHAAALNARPTLFLPVSLTAASPDQDERAELDEIVEDFSQRTGWKPGQVCQVAGAVRFSDYSFFTYWALRWIMKRKDPSATGHEDIEYTDWRALEKTVTDWSAALPNGT